MYYSILILDLAKNACILDSIYWHQYLMDLKNIGMSVIVLVEITVFFFLHGEMNNSFWFFASFVKFLRIVSKCIASMKRYYRLT